jgi:hypothetical protein
MSQDTTVRGQQGARQNPAPSRAGKSKDKASTGNGASAPNSEPVTGNVPTSEPEPEVDGAVAEAVSRLVHGQGKPTQTTAEDDLAPTMEDLRAAFGDKPQVAILEPPVVYEVREPKRNGEYFRTHPDRGLWLENLMLVDQEDFEKGVYPVGVKMVESLREFLKRCLLVPCITKKATIFIWPIPIADLVQKQRPTKIEKNKRKIALEATIEWRTIVWSRGQHIGMPPDDGGEYLGDPKWPETLTLDLIMERAFLPRLIANKKHDIAKIYLGLEDR